MRRHVSAEVLALHREGALSPRRAARVSAHLSVCTICTGVDAQLGAVKIALTATHAPPMPDVFAVRIQVAIANEAAMRVATSTAAAAAPGATASGAPGPQAAGVSGAEPTAGAAAGDGAGHQVGRGTDEPGQIPGRPDLPKRRRDRSRRSRMPNWTSPPLLRGLAAAGAVVIIAAAGILFIRGHVTSTNGTAGSATAPRSAKSGPLSGTGHPAAKVPDGNRPISMHYHLNRRIATARALTSDRNYTTRNMASLVRKDVASATVLGNDANSGTYQRLASPPALFSGIRVSTLMGCLTRLAAGRAIVVADVARYLGRPATIVVLRSSANAQEFNVVVVRLTCSLARPEIIAQVTIPPG
ncbi:MAG: hypothetical protein LBV34_13035 [Nocardiopsaceae bacterium]|nr:hypothetical protein [Nocardiopsaceae bacterium]